MPSNPSRSRSLLHTKHLQPFKDWLIAQGLPIREGRGAFQVMQVCVRGQWYAVYERISTYAGNNLVHYTTYGPVTNLAARFIRDYQKANSTDAEGSPGVQSVVADHSNSVAIPSNN